MRVANNKRTLRTLVIELAAAESAARRVDDDGGVELTFTMTDELFRAWLDLVDRLGGGSRRLH